MTEITGYNNTIRILMNVGCSERGARMAADLLMTKKDVVDRCEKLEAENLELKTEISIMSNYSDQYMPNEHLQEMYSELEKEQSSDE